jgi:hypothetical protein
VGPWRQFVFARPFFIIERTHHIYFVPFPQPQRKSAIYFDWKERQKRLGGGWSASAEILFLIGIVEQEPLVRFEVEPWCDRKIFFSLPCVGAKLNQPKITDYWSQGKISKELTNQDLRLQPGSACNLGSILSLESCPHIRSWQWFEEPRWWMVRVWNN